MGISILTALLVSLGSSCTRFGSSACSGLVYKEYGLNQKEYLPCARAMVGELDRYYQQLQIMGDKSLPMKERRAARAGCLAANARLVTLIHQAGGNDKLFYTRWDDATLNRLNYDIMIARDVYLMYCYYGPNDRFFDLAREDPSHLEARRELEELR